MIYLASHLSLDLLLLCCTALWGKQTPYMTTDDQLGNFMNFDTYMVESLKFGLLAEDTL